VIRDNKHIVFDDGKYFTSGIFFFLPDTFYRRFVHLYIHMYFFFFQVFFSNFLDLLFFIFLSEIKIEWSQILYTIQNV
jgi:hypothetical protein